MKKDINVGLVGYKFMGKAHSNGLTQLPMFFDTSANVVKKAICGRDPEWVEESRQKFGWESCETSWEALIDRKDIDVIDITAPSNVHKEIALAAASKGKHIFSEKPLALCTADAKEMYLAASKAGIKNQVGFNYRFAPAVVLAKKIIDSGKIGKVFHFRGSFLQDWIIDPDFPLVWRLDKKICGSGSHGDLGAHVIDMARYLVGDFDKVMGMSKTFVKQRPLVEKMQGLSGKAGADAPLGDVTVDDATIFMTEFKNGALGVFEATRFAAGHKNDMSFEINGDKGSLKFYFERMNELWYMSRDDEPDMQGFRLIQASEGIHNYASHWWPAGHVLGYENTFAHEFYEFYEAIANDKPTCPDFYDGMKCCQILDAVDKSVETRTWINVDEIQ